MVGVETGNTRKRSKKTLRRLFTRLNVTRKGKDLEILTVQSDVPKCEVFKNAKKMVKTYQGITDEQRIGNYDGM